MFKKPQFKVAVFLFTSEVFCINKSNRWGINRATGLLLNMVLNIVQPYFLRYIFSILFPDFNYDIAN